ncbi:MAG: acyl-CoA dehydrogenase family protein [Chitinispirillia bacterium]|nr:acyl-CoA dehydrogenase family protein [Chitinispirillia bacterium]MCL2269040.1 acyl-CoA dehydrogenase family protein [Chitinispirillia bacterium]
MNYFLTEEQQMIVDTARDIAHKYILPVREKYDHEGIFPWDVVEKLAEADMCGLYIPEEYGGFGGGVMELCLAVEELSKIDGGISLALAATALGTFPILLHASEEQKKKYLPDIAAGKSIAAFGLTEANAGSDALGMKTTAVLDGNEWVINGTKQWITNGENAKVYTVFAKTNPAKGARGLSCFIIEKGTPGFTFGKHEDKMGIRASSTTELVFQDCRIPKDAILGKEGLGAIVAIHTLNNSRPGVGSQALGIAAGALDDAVKYSRERVQFGSPISSFQAVQHMLADMATEVEAARALMYATARWVDDLKKNGSRESFAKESAMTKLFCSDVAMRVTVDALQVMGGYGYMKEYPMEKRMRDAKITQIYEGTNQIQRNEIALQLIKGAAS